MTFHRFCTFTLHIQTTYSFIYLYFLGLYTLDITMVGENKKFLSHIVEIGTL